MPRLPLLQPSRDLPLDAAERRQPRVRRARAGADDSPGWADALLRGLGLLLMVLALSSPLLHRPDRAVDTLVARWAPPPSQLIDLDGQLLHLRDEGPRTDAAPLLLLHGMGSSLQAWDGWARALRGQRRVIRLDLPGCGLTGPWDGDWAGRRYDGAAWAAFVLRVMDQLQLPRAVLVGHGLGGEAAWQLARQQPARVQALVLLAATGYADQPGTLPPGWRVARLPLLGALWQDMAAPVLTERALRQQVGDPGRVSAAMVERRLQLDLRDGNRAAQRQQVLDWLQSSGVARVDGVRQPTLLLWGARDAQLPVALAQRWAADIPGSQLQRFDTLGHLLHEEDPAATVRAARDFLARQGL